MMRAEDLWESADDVSGSTGGTVAAVAAVATVVVLWLWVVAVGYCCCSAAVTGTTVVSFFRFLKLNFLGGEKVLRMFWSFSDSDLIDCFLLLAHGLLSLSLSCLFSSPSRCSLVGFMDSYIPRYTSAGHMQAGSSMRLLHCVTGGLCPLDTRRLLRCGWRLQAESRGETRFAC